jgi:hypothetical protein
MKKKTKIPDFADPFKNGKVKLEKHPLKFSILFVQGTELAMCNDIANRQKLGLNKYGTTVADNPLTLKQWLQHAYEECLDQAVYLKRAIEEIEKK